MKIPEKEVRLVNERKFRFQEPQKPGFIAGDQLDAIHASSMLCGFESCFDLHPGRPVSGGPLAQVLHGFYNTAGDIQRFLGSREAAESEPDRRMEPFLREMKRLQHV